jgi:ribosomal peptide maturation radical SAM protein 1
MTRRQLPLALVSRNDWAAQSRPARPLRIALVNMPWARCDTPSIQCGLLKAGLVRHGHRVDVKYLNLALSAYLGPDAYTAIWSLPEERQNLLGDWVFTLAAYADEPFPADVPTDVPVGASYLDRCLDLAGPLGDRGLTVKDIVELREHTLPQWIREQGSAIDWGSYDVVGFTSTFAQNLAALALAKDIKRHHPSVVTIFGGANFDGEMGPEYVRVFPTIIDFAVSGEGDIILPVLLARLSAGQSPLGLPGVSGHDAAGNLVVGGQAPKVEDMDSLPEPDYTDYFQLLQSVGRSNVLGRHQPVLLFESSRGCWWGEKHHCTFCGLNAQGMMYRAKSPRRAMDELSTMVDRHKVLVVAAVDNIMDMSYFGSLCAELGEARWDVRMFYEVKANLTRAQLRSLKDAGITTLQPGLESLSTHVLGLMRKGSTMLTNLKLLKWCRYYDIQVEWNILTGFPGELDADYENQIALIPSLLHLPPPSGAAPIWLERFSPYFTGEFPIFDVRPQESYRFVYPMPDIDLQKIAYFFDYRAEKTASAPVLTTLSAAVEDWRQHWSSDRTPPTLAYQRGPNWLAIHDTRGPKPRRITLDGWQALAYEHCADKAHTAARVREHLVTRSVEVTEQQATAFLESAVAERLMVGEDGKYLSLALPRNRNW